MNTSICPHREAEIYLNHNVRKCAFGHEHPEKTQINLHISKSDKILHFVSLKDTKVSLKDIK